MIQFIDTIFSKTTAHILFATQGGVQGEFNALKSFILFYLSAESEERRG